MTTPSVPRDRRFHPTSHLFLGIIIAALGVLFTLDNLNVVSANAYLRYWPALVILFGLFKIAQARATGGWVGGAIWVVIGSVLLANRLGYLADISLHKLWPLLLVLFGVRIASRAFYDPGVVEGAQTDATSVTSAIAVLGGVDRKITSQTFQHGELTAFMGGGKLDLREAGLAGGQATIHVLAMMGGFEIFVPDSWNVAIEVTPVLGGIDDKRRPTAANAAAPRLILRGFVMMGGVEIKS
jgi:cell wall-active antibiotic response 4TMS protein YvqF